MLAPAIQRIILLVAILHGDLVVPLTRLEWLGLHVEVALSVVAPVLAHISTDVVDMSLPVGATDHVDAELAVLSIAINILLIRGRLHVDAGSQGDELVQEPSIV